MGSLRQVIAAGALAASPILAVQPAAALEPVVFFDFFLFDNAGQPQDDFQTFLQWNVGGGSVDLVGGNIPGVPLAPPDQPAGRYVDLGGSTGDPGLFETRLPQGLVPGTYRLDFLYRSALDGQSNSASGNFAGQSFSVSSSTAAFTSFSQLFTVALGGATPIAFQNAESDTDGFGVGIDAVILRQVLLADGTPPLVPGLPLPAVPEPSSWALMLLGFGLTGVAVRRTRRQDALAA